MFIANENYSLLPQSYLFSEVAKRIRDYSEHNPSAEIIRMDIGDVTLPLFKVVREAMSKALEDMGKVESFRGYGPEQGYLFLREKIAAVDYQNKGITTIGPDDIFVSDGAKSDLGNLTDLFGKNLRIGVPDPGYPVYRDSNILAGNGGELRSGEWSGIRYLDSGASSGFIPSIPEEKLDVIYLCYPNNPTGIGISQDELKKWVDYALKNKTLIIYDSAYEAYVRTPGIARSIYEIDGSEKTAIEVRSFSKNAGFTGVRCGYTVVPRTLEFQFPDGQKADLNKMWNRRQSTKFNGVGYIVQKGAEALYSPEGQKEIRCSTDYYLNNAKRLRDSLINSGLNVYGAIDSPYVWFNGGNLNGDSWRMFDDLLKNCGISSTPGSGFGRNGEGYLRFTGFNTPEKTDMAIGRLQYFFQK